MAYDPGPWGNTPDGGGDAPRRHGFWIWLALIAAGALAFWQLWRLFPNALSNATDQGAFMRGCVLLALIASGVAYRWRFSLREAVRNIAIWCGVVAVLVFGTTFYQQAVDAASEARSALIPGYPAQSGPDTMTFHENEDGDFPVIGKVDGTTVEFVVDTGASDIVLTPADAKRIGIDLSKLEYIRTYETANGEGRGAFYTAGTLEIGPLKLVNVQVTVNGAAMRSSLLGMSFLRRMKSFEMRGRKLTLRWR